MRIEKKRYRENNILYVGNLSYFCNEEDLTKLIQQYGEPLDVEISRNRRQSKSLMFGFVTMATIAEAEEIIDLLDGHLFMGRNLK